ncbi:MAG: response regulator [Chloroflexi bacterium]|nr:response regulator [Chloroflexota bacterium]
MNKILILSNDPVFRQKNTKVLTKGGFQVADAPDALDGLLMIDKNGFDAIVIDEELSGIDGYWACRKIRQYSEIPIILLGNEPVQEVWEKIDDFGFDMYLKKSVKPRELMAHIKAILRRTRGEEEIEPSREEKPSEVEPAPAAPLPEVEPVQKKKLVGVQPQKIICSNCKSDNPAGQKLCRTCGAKLTDETQPTLVTPLPETGPVRLAETAKRKAVTNQTVADSSPVISETTFGAWRDARVVRLIDALVKGKIAEISPIIDIAAKGGFTYPAVDRLLETSGEETAHILEILAKDDILNRKLFEKLHVDPEGSLELVPVERCPHCGSVNLLKGQLIEHFGCGNVALNQDYMSDHKYICPKCKKELKLLGTDYRYAGMQYRCLDDGDIFPTPVTKWRSLQTGRVWAMEELQEAWIYSYSLNPDRKDWLEFQLKPKAQLIDFLRVRGYQVEELAELHGASGATYTIDILASRDDGLAQFRMGIGILTALLGENEVGLDELFKFDTKAYDTGINYKAVIALPRLSPEATKFAERQKIGVFEVADPETFMSYLSSQARPAPAVPTRAKARYPSKMGATSGPQARVAEFLRQHGYEVFEKAKVPGKSGAEHVFDIFAQRDDVIIRPTIAVAIATADDGQAVGVGKVAQFDAEVFDTGIRNKVLVAIPQTTAEAKQLARQQRIRVLDEHELEGLIHSSAAA